MYTISDSSSVTATYGFCLQKSNLSIFWMCFNCRYTGSLVLFNKKANLALYILTSFSYPVLLKVRPNTPLDSSTFKFVNLWEEESERGRESTNGGWAAVDGPDDLY